jgi:hypothetical protein
MFVDVLDETVDWENRNSIEVIHGTIYRIYGQHPAHTPGIQEYLKRVAKYALGAVDTVTGSSKQSSESSCVNIPPRFPHLLSGNTQFVQFSPGVHIDNMY